MLNPPARQPGARCERPCLCVPGAQVCREPGEENAAGWAQEGPSLPALLPWLSMGSALAPTLCSEPTESTLVWNGCIRSGVLSEIPVLLFEAPASSDLQAGLWGCAEPLLTCVCLQGTPSEGEDESKRQTVQDQAWRDSSLRLDIYIKACSSVCRGRRTCGRCPEESERAGTVTGGSVGGFEGSQEAAPTIAARRAA